jgi:hypothetical protein
LIPTGGGPYGNPTASEVEKGKMQVTNESVAKQPLGKTNPSVDTSNGHSSNSTALGLGNASQNIVNKKKSKKGEKS